VVLIFALISHRMSLLVAQAVWKGARTIDGRPGRLVREGSSLVCRPIGTDARSVDALTCPDCDGDGEDDSGNVCPPCQGSGQLDDDNGGNGETATSDRRATTVDAMSAAHQQNMAKIYQQISDDVSQQWRKP
jgi:hypothetical protein